MSEPAPSPRDPRQRQRYEVTVFLLLVLPSLALSFVPATGLEPDFSAVALGTIVRDLSLLALVAYFVWAGGQPLAALGWRGQGARRELMLGVMLFVPMFFALALLEVLLNGFGLEPPTGPPAYLLPEGLGEHLLAVLLLGVVAVAEETIFRGYLLLRFTALTHSRALAVILSTLVFAVGHGYQGPAGVIGVALLGLAFAVIYLWRDSLVAPATLHFLQNFVGLIIAPQVNGGG